MFLLLPPLLTLLHSRHCRRRTCCWLWCLVFLLLLLIPFLGLLLFNDGFFQRVRLRLVSVLFGVSHELGWVAGVHRAIHFELVAVAHIDLEDLAVEVERVSAWPHARTHNHHRIAGGLLGIL